MEGIQNTIQILKKRNIVLLDLRQLISLKCAVKNVMGFRQYYNNFVSDGTI